MAMIVYDIIDSTKLSDDIKKFLVDFIFENLGEFTDDKVSIMTCLNYITDSAYGGEVYVAKEDEKIIGVIIINKTGMTKFIPENILVYVTVDSNYRGRKIGKTLMQHMMKKIRGDIALHVEPHNKTKNLFSALGFTNKYLEMRYVKEV